MGLIFGSNNPLIVSAMGGGDAGDFNAFVISDIFDFSDEPEEGDVGILPTASGPFVLRYKAACTVAFGGTRQAWITDEAYRNTPVIQMWTDGSENNTALAAQGWTVLNDSGCTVTATGGFQRLSATGSNVSARLRGMISGVSSGTKMEALIQARADLGTGGAIMYLPLFADGTNVTSFGQSIAVSGLGFFDGASSGPLQTPIRNGTAATLPALASTAATLLIRDEGRGVQSSAIRDGQLVGDYRRNLQTSSANLLQISSLKVSGTGSASLDFRGQVITY